MGRGRIEVVMAPVDQGGTQRHTGGQALQPAIPFELLFEETMDPADPEPVARRVIREHGALQLRPRPRWIAGGRAQQHDLPDPFGRGGFERVDADAQGRGDRAYRIALELGRRRQPSSADDGAPGAAQGGARPFRRREVGLTPFHPGSLERRPPVGGGYDRGHASLLQGVDDVPSDQAGPAKHGDRRHGESSSATAPSRWYSELAGMTSVAGLPSASSLSIQPPATTPDRKCLCSRPASAAARSRRPSTA